MTSNYFILHHYIRFVGDEKSGCIYNTLTGEMIKLDSDHARIVSNSLKNIPIQKNEQAFVKQMEEGDIGRVYDTPNYHEQPRAGVGKQFKEYLDKRVYLKNFYLQVSNECNLNCLYCNDSVVTVRPTSCKKWNNKEMKIEKEKFSKLFKDAKNVGCENIHLLGGEPLLAINKVLLLLELAEPFGFENIYIYTNLTLLNDKTIEISKYNNVVFVVEIHSLSQETYQRITSSLFNVADVLENVSKLRNMNFKVFAHVSLSKYNDDEVLGNREAFKNVFDSVYIDFIYPINNFHYSRKLINEIYKRHFRQVRKESIVLLEDYNSDFYGKLSLNMSGDYTPCPMINDIVLGNIENLDVLNVIASEEYKKLVKMTRSHMPKCKNCNFRLNCFDIRSIEYSATGKIDGVEFCDV